MKVIFLDIDGVVNSLRSCAAYGGTPLVLDELDMFDHVALCMVRNLCSYGDIQIVLSSTWRKFNKVEDLAQGLDLPIVAATPFIQGAIRGIEIKAWLDANPEVSCYAILDDDVDMLPEQLGKFVQVDRNNGLSWENFLRLCEIFNLEFIKVIDSVE